MELGFDWILDSNRVWDSGFFELYSGLQSQRFRIPQAKFSWMTGTLTWGELSLGEVLRLLPFEPYFPIIFPFRVSKRKRLISHCTSSLQAKTNFQIQAKCHVIHTLLNLAPLSSSYAVKPPERRMELDWEHSVTHPVQSALLPLHRKSAQVHRGWERSGSGRGSISTTQGKEG